MRLRSDVPRGVRRGFVAALGVGLPHAVGQLVADGRQHLDELQGPLVQVQGAHPGEVGAQVPVDPRALDADQGAQVEAGPVGVWWGGREARAHTYGYTHTQTNVWTHTHTDTDKRMDTHTHRHRQMYGDTHSKRMDTHTHKRMETHTHTHTHTHTQTYRRHTQTRTHTQNQCLNQDSVDQSK